MKLKTSVRNTFFLLLLCMMVAACNPSPYYQHETPLLKNDWSWDNRLSFKFEVSDTNAYYIPYFLIRHTDAYPYKNVWLWMYIKEPDQKEFHKLRLNIQLAESSGQWLGRGMGEIWEQRLRITGLGDSVSIHKSGPYEIRFEQNMRIDPLPEILNVGLRIEKIPFHR